MAAGRRGAGEPRRRHRRAGTYDVEVSLRGYGLWQQSGVVAPLGACNVETATLQVTLQPASR